MNYRGAKVNITGEVTSKELHSAWLQLQNLKGRGQNYFRGENCKIVSLPSGDVINLVGRFPKEKEKEKPEEKKQVVLIPVEVVCFAYDVGDDEEYSGRIVLCGTNSLPALSENGWYNCVFDSSTPLAPNPMHTFIGSQVIDLWETNSTDFKTLPKADDYIITGIYSEEFTNTFYLYSSVGIPMTFYHSRYATVSFPCTAFFVGEGTWQEEAASLTMAGPWWGVCGDCYAGGTILDNFFGMRYTSCDCIYPLNGEYPVPAICGVNGFAIPSWVSTSLFAQYSIGADWSIVFLKYLLTVREADWTDSYGEEHECWGMDLEITQRIRVEPVLSGPVEDIDLPDIAFPGNYITATKNVGSTWSLGDDYIQVYFSGCPLSMREFATANHNKINIAINGARITAASIGLAIVKIRQVAVYSMPDPDTRKVFVVYAVLDDTDHRHFVFRRETDNTYTNLSAYFDGNYKFLRVVRARYLVEKEI